MEKYRSKKILTIVVMMVAIVGLSVGFAAFSSVLTIQSEATVTPDASTFSVKFSKVSDSILDGKTNLVYPISGNGEGAEIDNSGNPTITGLKANISAPGDTVQYKFYVRNTGEYLAYLNEIRIGENTCKAGTISSESLQDACNSIKINVKIGSMNEVSTTTKGITNQTLAINSYQEVLVTIKYDEYGTRADGTFDVNLGDVTLIYSTVADFELADGCTGPVDPTRGNLVTCGSESFYVMSNNGSTITMLAQYNLNFSKRPYTQDAAYKDKTIDFFELETTPEEVNNSEIGYENSTVKEYVKSYESYLRGTWEVSTATARLMTKTESETLGCIGNEYLNCKNGGAPSWVYSTTYWLGTGEGSDYYNYYQYMISSAGEMGTAPLQKFEKNCVTDKLSTGLDSEVCQLQWAGVLASSAGIRPVITINISDYNKA